MVLAGCGSSPSPAAVKQRYIARVDEICRAIHEREAPILARLNSGADGGSQTSYGEDSQTLSGELRAGNDQIREVTPPPNDRLLISRLLEQLDAVAEATSEVGTAAVAQAATEAEANAGGEQASLREGQREGKAFGRRAQATLAAAAIANEYGFKICGQSQG